jgi:hypothetical protein
MNDSAFTGFKFAPGDLVEHRSTPGIELAVLSRCLEEWPDGTSRTYICRGLSTAIPEGVHHLYEHELQPATE